MLSRFPSTFAIIVEEVSGSAAVDNAPPHPQTIRSGDFFVVGSSRTSDLIIVPIALAMLVLSDKKQEIVEEYDHVKR